MEIEVISNSPDCIKYPTPLLFVHGAWHGAWCWKENFFPYFSAQGFKCYAMSFRGHGESEGKDQLKRSRLKDYVQDLHQAIEQMETVPIVIGHSLGGFVVQKYLEEVQLPKAILLASIAPHGSISPTVRIMLRHPWPFTKIHFSLNLYPLISSTRLSHDLLFSDKFPQKKAKEIHKFLQPESYLAYLDTLFLNLPKASKIGTEFLVLGAECDRIIGRKDNEATARAYDAKLHMIPELAHDMMLDTEWKVAADKIIDWLKPQASRVSKKPL